MAPTMTPSSTLYPDFEPGPVGIVGEATTQTDLTMLPFSSETQTSSSDAYFTSSCSSSTDDDTSEADSVIDRLTRSVGRIFSLERVDRGTQTAKDPLASETEKLAFDVVFFVLGKRNSKPGDDVIRCLRHGVLKMLDNHSIVFNGMMSRLQVNRETDLKLGFDQMTQELFAYDEITWPKVVALFAFGARLSLYCHEHKQEDMVYDVATILGQLAVDKLTPFLRANGGWNQICEVFPLESDFEHTLWKSLIVTGMGLTAVATILALKR